MAADPTIRAAWEKAAWAECEARAKVNECEDKRCPRREPCPWCAQGAAAAIAAFLDKMREAERANIAEFRAQGLVGPTSDAVAVTLWLGEQRRAIADAVKEAAKELPHD